MFDVTIIGCGVIGALLARKLSQYDLRILILERENDVAMGTTKANSAIVHAGYDPEPGTLMSKLNVQGSEQMEKLCRELDVEYRRCGSMVLAFSAEETATLKTLYDRGIKNGVKELRLLSGEEARTMEPALAETVRGALLAPTAAIVDPWGLCLAAAETAVRNGAELKRGSAVAGVEVNHVIFQCPSVLGKGVLVAPTVHGNLIVGPNAEPVEDGDDRATTQSGLDQVAAFGRKSVPSIDLRQSIRNFSGVRAVTSEEDFIIRPAKNSPRMLYVCGIKSPGLSAAPAIADYALEKLKEMGLAAEKKTMWSGKRTQIRFRKLSDSEKAELVRKDPRYGRIICRCETITEGEIIAAIHSPIPPCSIDGVKRRTGAGMGRCQGGFCGPRVLKILADELGKDPMEIVQDGSATWLLMEETKGGSGK